MDGRGGQGVGVNTMTDYSDLNDAQLKKMLKAAEELAVKQLGKLRKLERQADNIAQRLAKCENRLQIGQGGDDGN